MEKGTGLGMPPAKSVRGKNARTGASQFLKFIALKFGAEPPKVNGEGFCRIWDREDGR
jgi:hypothetical protein